VLVSFDLLFIVTFAAFDGHGGWLFDIELEAQSFPNTTEPSLCIKYIVQLSLWTREDSQVSYML
jgi:hypothetical protein